MRLAVCLLLLALPAAAAQLDRKTQKKIEAFGVKWWKARPKNKFHDWNSADRARLLEEADGIGTLPEGSLPLVRDLLWKSLKKNGPKGKGRDKLFLDSPYKLKMWAYVSAARGKNKGLVMGLHGGGKGAGSADGPRGTWQIKGCMGMYPQGLVLQGDNWNTVQGEKQILSLIEIAKAQHDIDPDRVYCVGFSMGGTGSWHMAGRHPDLLAGAAPCAGVIMAKPKSQLANKDDVLGLQYGLLPNVRNLAMYYFIGLEDRNCMPGTYLFAWDEMQELMKDDPTGYKKIKFKTYPGLAHAFPPGEPGSCTGWLAEQKRDTFPQKLVWYYARRPYPLRKTFDRTTRIEKRWFYWIRHDNPSDKMEVIAERKGNEFDIVPPVDRKGMRLMLNPEMIDVKNDVIVRLDGEEFYRGKPQPNFRDIVESLDAKLDKRMLFDRSIDLSEKE
ncbi:MAG: dienelactone hydrolase family protein [Planctomycetota bacterium]